jgi:hypothetical protein
MTENGTRDYKNGKIYMIQSPSTGAIYIGSTCGLLRKRMNQHIRDMRKWKNGTHGYTTSFKVLENEDAEITLIEDFPCDRKEQLIARERYYIGLFDSTNKLIPGRTKSEWYEDNKERFEKPKHCGTCDCDVRSDGYWRHTKSKKHGKAELSEASKSNDEIYTLRQTLFANTMRGLVVDDVRDEASETVRV